MKFRILICLFCFTSSLQAQSFIWVRPFDNGIISSGSTDITIDADKNIIHCGFVYQRFAYGADTVYPLHSDTDIFVSKVSPEAIFYG